MSPDQAEQSECTQKRNAGVEGSFALLAGGDGVTRDMRGEGIALVSCKARSSAVVFPLLLLHNYLSFRLNK
jgi:hypothetical protein